MSIMYYNKKYYDCKLNNLDIYFEYNNSVVFDIEQESITIGKENVYKCKKLLVITKCELDKYNNILEINRYGIVDNLIIQGIISFFTGIPLTFYDNDKNCSSVKPIEYEKQEIHLIIDDIDYSNDLKIMLDKLDKEPILITTLLDRWRKAIYLREESFETELFYDEAILSFFHIFELFGESISDELKNKLEINIESMLYKHFKCYYFTDIQIKQFVEQNKKSVNTLLIGNSLKLAVKIKYFLEKYELLDDNVSFFIDNMIRVRNAIAHGRITFQKIFIWPLSPFLNLSKYSFENIDFLQFLSAKMISKYLGIDCWEKEWSELKKFLMPSDYIMTTFLNNNLVIENFNYDMLIQGNKYNITWRTLFNYYVKNSDKIIRERIEKRIKTVFIETPIDKDNAPDIFNISIIFADSEDSDIKQKAIENVKVIISNCWYGWSNFKDVLSYLDFYFVKIIWYKEFLLRREYILFK